MNDYITIHTKNFDFYFINCEFVMQFDSYFKTTIETNYFYNTDITNTKKYLLYYIDCFRPRGYQVYKFTKMTIKTISDRCHMVCGDYYQQPMLAVERRIIKNIDKNLQLLNSFNH